MKKKGHLGVSNVMCIPFPSPTSGFTPGMSILNVPSVRLGKGLMSPCFAAVNGMGANSA